VAGVALEALPAAVEEWGVLVAPVAEAGLLLEDLVVAPEPGQLLSARSGVQTPTLRWPKNVTQLVLTLGGLSRSPSNR